MPPCFEEAERDASARGVSATGDLPGAVRRIVVDKNGFEREAGQRLFQPPKQRGDIVPLVEGRDNDRKIRQTNDLRWIPVPHWRSVIHDASVYPIVG